MSDQSASWRGPPDIDPTTVTVEQFSREREQSRADTQALKELLETKIEALEAVITQRLDAMDKATELLNAQMTAVPSDTDKQVGQLKELHSARFASIEQQFNEREVAVAAALASAERLREAQVEATEKAAEKAEATTTKLLQENKDQVTALNKSLSERLDAAVKALEQQIRTVEARLAEISAVTG